MAQQSTHKKMTSVKALAKKRYNLKAPRFWHGMRVGTWMRLLMRNGFRLSPSRVPATFSISCFSVLNSGLSLLERLIYSSKIRRTEIREAPIFILGHWRSGTTHLHELLIRDPHHTYATTCECFAPHHFLLTEWLITRFFGWAMPGQRPMDDMETGWSRPQEDEFALVSMGVPSPYLSMAFPNDGSVFEDYLTLENLTADQRDAWQQALRQFLQRIALRRPQRIVLKSPPHTARVATLLEMFPDARFVHIVREPNTLFASTVRTWQALNFVQGLHVPKDETWLDEYVLDSFERMYASFQRDRELLADNQLFEVRYEELIENPHAVLQAMYNQLDLGDYSLAREAISGYLEKTRDYRTSDYKVVPEMQEEIRRRWADYGERYGYFATAQQEPAAAS